MKTILRLTLISALVVSTGAAAQLSATLTVQRNFTVPVSAGSYSNVNASCPAGYVALSGGVDNNFSSADIEVTTLAPTFGGSGLLVQADGTRGAPDGWYASVINYGAVSRVVMATAVCAPISGVITVIASSAVTAGTNATPGTGALATTCPSGYIATGGGLDVSRPEAMKVISTSPHFGATNSYLVDRSSGTNPAPAGWFGLISNQGLPAGTMKVAAICATLSGVITQVLRPIAIAPGTHDGIGLVCPAGYIATGGGLDSAELHALIATVSSPRYNGAESAPVGSNDRLAAYPANLQSGNYPAPAGWFADAYNRAASGNRNLVVGFMCAPIANVPPGTVVTVFEFYNTSLKHYFRTSSVSEALGIVNGSAGAGWVLTGDNFTAYAPGVNAPGSDVCRFYTFGANSHFYTAFADECAGLKSPSSGWVYEGLSFRIQLPAVSSCPVGTNPVYRLYNNRFAFTDSNHRFTTNFTSVQALQGLGWQYEGVAFCALNYSGG